MKQLLVNGRQNLVRDGLKIKHLLIHLEQNIFPWIGKRPIKEVTAPELLSALRRVESRVTIETAHRTLQICGQIFRYGIVTSRAERDISAVLKGALHLLRKVIMPVLLILLRLLNYTCN